MYKQIPICRAVYLPDLYHYNPNYKYSQEENKQIYHNKYCKDVKEHILQMLRTWAFTDWETVFAAKADVNQVVRHKSLICAAENPVLQDFQPITARWAVIEYALITETEPTGCMSKN